jgi:DNA polymerase-3 subunit gamma/tau
VLDTLGLAGNLKTAHILNAIRRGDAAGAITQFGDLYAAGKDVTAVLSELTGLCRDLLIRQTAPEAGMGLMAGGYDEATLKTLSKNLPAERLIAMLELLEQAAEDCKRSGSSRTVAEICLIRLCDPSLDGSNAGLAARIARLEAAVAQGIPVADLQSEKPDQPLQPISTQTQPQKTAQPQPVAAPVATPEVTGPSASAQALKETKPTQTAAAAADEWTQLVGGMKGKVPMTAYPFLKNTEKVIGRRQGSLLTIYYLDDFAYDQSNKPEVLRAITDSVSAQLGQAIQVDLRKGAPTEETPAPQQQEQPSKPVGSISDLKQFMKQHQS